MNKYFCKYLPVEGEIREDSYIHTGDGAITSIKWMMENIPKFNLDSYNKAAKGWGNKNIPDRFRPYPVKLFLCSRNDIQISNKVFLENNYNWFATVINKIGNSDRDIVLDIMPEDRKNGTLDFREMVKIIGAISENAIWVKEGDEFEEEDIKLVGRGYYEDKLITSFDYTEAHKEQGYTCYVEIKCTTCQTFH